MDPIYRFITTPDGQHHSGIPARDLDEADVAALTDDQRATLDASSIYRKVERPAPQTPAVHERRPTTTPKREQAGG